MELGRFPHWCRHPVRRMKTATGRAGGCGLLRWGCRWAFGPAAPSSCFSFFLLFSFFLVEKKREEKKGKLGHKNYDNNFYEMPILKSSNSQTFGSEVFKISFCLNLNLNLQIGFNNRKII